MRKKIPEGDLEGNISTQSNGAGGRDDVSVLKGIREAQHDLALRFEESSKNMEEEIADLIGSLLDTTRESFETIERLGSSILIELEKTENEVTQAWGTLNANLSRNDRAK